MNILIIEARERENIDVSIPLVQYIEDDQKF